MTQKDVATIALLFVTLLLSIVAIGSPGWVQYSSGSAGLFQRCLTQSRCTYSERKSMSTSEVITAVFLIISAVSQVISIACFTVSLAWSKRNLPFLGFLAAAVAALFLIGSCVIYTSMNYNDLSDGFSFGYSFVIAWVVCGICSFTVSVSYLAYADSTKGKKFRPF